MKSTIGRSLVGCAALAAALAGVLAVGPAPAAVATAHAAHPADLQLSYRKPRITRDGTAILYRWTLTNRGTTRAVGVSVWHRVWPRQRVNAVSRSCAASGAYVRCDLGSLAPGGKRSGWLRTAMVRGARGVRISGGVTWREIDPYADVPARNHAG